MANPTWSAIARLWKRFLLCFVSWNYLGYCEVSWCDPSNKDVIVARAFIHFYAKGKSLECRRVIASGKRPREHNYYHSVVVRWLEGGNLWRLSLDDGPSDFFKDWTKKKCGWEWVGDKW